jgi:hypothetical protein
VFAAVAGVEPPLQLYVPPPVAVALSDVIVHVSTVVAGGVIPAVGGVVFDVIVMLDVAVQPLGDVTVTT